MSWLRGTFVSAIIFISFAILLTSNVECSEIYLFENDTSLLITDTYSPGYTKKIGTKRIYGYGSAQMKRLPATYDQMIEEITGRYSVSSDLVKAVIQVESNFDSTAISPKGAKGLMQLIDGTAKRFGVNDVFDPYENIMGGVRYLRYLTDLFGGDLSLVLAGYNAGERAVLDYGGIPPYSETMEYVKSVKRLIGSSEVTKVKKKVTDRSKPYLTFTDKGTVCIVN